MIHEHLAILPVLVPLLTAMIAVLLRHRRTVRLLALASCWTTFALALMLVQDVVRHGTLSYALGGWAAPWGIEYRTDSLSAFVILIVAGSAAVVLTYSPASVRREIAGDRQYLFHAVYLLCVSGLIGIAATGDLFNLFVFLEISSLSSYTLIALGSDRRALTAAFQYLVLGTIGATFILIGIGLMYQLTGTLNMAGMATQLNDVSQLRTSLVALAFFSVGICLKMALFPLHIWLPNAYTYAPSVVTAFLAATATKVSVYVFLRVLFTVFGYRLPFESLNIDWILLPMSVLGIFVASTVAIFERNVKRMLAYSSVAQIGYIVLGISFASVTGVTAGIVHLFNHALIKGGLFLAMGCFALRVGSVRLDDLAGVGRRMPWTTFAWVLGGLGLIGVPGTAGFITKWLLLDAAIERGWWPLAWAILISSLLAVVYVWRVVEVVYFREPPAGAPPAREARASMLIPTYVVMLATLAFGLVSTFPRSMAERAAESLLDPPPIQVAPRPPVDAALDPEARGSSALEHRDS